MTTLADTISPGTFSGQNSGVFAGIEHMSYAAIAGIIIVLLILASVVKKIVAHGRHGTHYHDKSLTS